MHIANKDQTIADKEQTISTLSDQNVSLAKELEELKTIVASKFETNL